MAHPSRTCANCAHTDPEFECLQMVYMADGSHKPADFGCHEHQTQAELRLNLHRPDCTPLKALGEGS